MRVGGEEEDKEAKSLAAQWRGRTIVSLQAGGESVVHFLNFGTLMGKQFVEMIFEKGQSGISCLCYPASR